MKNKEVVKKYNVRLTEEKLLVAKRVFMSFMKAAGLTGSNKEFVLFESIAFDVDKVIHQNKLCHDPKCNFEEYRKKKKLMIKKEGN